MTIANNALIYEALCPTICNSAKESGTCGGGEGKKAMDCSRHRVLACIACASDRCNEIERIRWNHVHNKLLVNIQSGASMVFYEEMGECAYTVK